MPPMNATGGDLVDHVREWLDRQRERFAGRKNGHDARPVGRRISRRQGSRVQAVPLGSAQASASRFGTAGRHRAGRRADRAARGPYTLILGAVLLVLVAALFFAINWAIGSGTSSAVATPTPQVAVAPSPAPKAVGVGLPPVPSPSPSPAPSPAITTAAPQQRFHVVEGGDTLNRISQRYGVTVEAIMQANGFTDRNRILRIGERLVIPDPLPGSPIPR
ncbi:MAG: LysM peptidoglycan-binding domain-containing protein [Chloroflexi bacterium]|nr:LysM peptidoglycan-binding domain-containing protein [Chloroflexota bacterium]